MRHLFVTNDFPPKQGGIESYLVNLARGFDPDAIGVVAPARDGYEAVDAALPYRVHRVSGTYLRATRSVLTQIVEAAQAHEARAVHFLQALPLGRLAPAVRERTGAVVTIVAHGSGDIIVPSRAPLVRRSLRQALASADLVLAVSEFTRGRVEQLTRGQARLGLLPPSVDVERFSLAVTGARIRYRHELGTRFVVLFVSRLVKRKGADALIRAMPGVPRSALVIAGSGPEEQALRRLVDELDLGRRVTFAGQVPDDELPEYYAAADVFCMPATDRLGGLDTEGFGVVYLEAAAAGVPCIGGRAGGSAEAVLDGITGFVLSDPTPLAVAEALKAVEADETMRVLLGASGRQRVEREFAPKVLARRLEDQLTGLRAGARDGR